MLGAVKNCVIQVSSFSTPGDPACQASQHSRRGAPTPAGLCVAVDKSLGHGVPQVICEVGVAVKLHWLGLGFFVSTRNSK